MINEMHWKESIYLLPTPVFTEEIGEKPHSECTNDFRKGCHQNMKQQRSILLKSCKNNNTNFEALFLEALLFR
jgi:hypothetical protein